MPVSVANANKKCGPSKSGPPYEQTGVFLSMPAERIRELSERTRKYIKERRITKDTLPALLSTGEETAAASGSLLTAGINGNPSDASLNSPVHGQPRNEVAEDGIQEKPVDGGEAKTAADSGQQYEGDKDSDGKPHGRGKLIKTGEYEYEGEFCHGKFHGKGTFKDLPGDFERDGTFEDGTFVEGSFTKGDQVEHGQFQQNSHGILTLHGHAGDTRWYCNAPPGGYL